MKNKAKKNIMMALQGGGSHGAFTWGVLDRFLEEKNLDIEALCGTSAGAMNATLIAYGLTIGDKETARELLHKFWKTTSDVGKMFGIEPSWYDKWLGLGNMDFSPTYNMMDMISHSISPYQFNPLDINPLRDILLSLIDFSKLGNCTEKVRLYVCATNVRKCRARVFEPHEITIDALMASACLPFLFKAVTIDGEDYWDGGYMGNPPIYPLIRDSKCNDVMIVQINPITIPKTPQTAVEIRDRINEITFNSSLMLEMRRANFMQKLMQEGYDYHGKIKEIHYHLINPQEHIGVLNLSSKLNTTWEFLSYLRDLGRTYASDWLDAHYDKIDIESTCNLQETFL